MNSRLHKEISKVEISAICANLLGNNAEIIEYRLLGGGMFNTTYFVHAKCTGGERKFVVRIAPINRQYLYSYEREMMRAEGILQRMIGDAGIPTTNIIQYVPAGKIIDREYSITEFLPSIPMNDPSLKDVDLSYIFEDVGRYTKIMHSITADGFGWAIPDGDGKITAPHKTWYDFLIAHANENIERMTELDYFTRDEASRQIEIIQSRKAMFDKVTVPYMNHTDLWEGNVLLRKALSQKDEGTDKYEIAAIIDTDRTIFGDREFEFAMGWMCNDHYYKGYNEICGACSPESDDEKAETETKRMIYSMLYQFFQTYIFSTQFDYPDTSKYYAERIREKYSRLLDK
jgi:Predicted aminoglycoside phosphotransferase